MSEQEQDAGAWFFDEVVGREEIEHDRRAELRMVWCALVALAVVAALIIARVVIW